MGKTLHRSVARGVSAGEPLPSPFPIFAAKKISWRRGSIHMIAGPPGSMKTVLMMNIVRAMGPTVPTLYHSSDSDDFTMATRAVAMHTGMQTDEAEFLVLTNPKLATAALKDMSYVKWNFHAAPTLDLMWAEADAYREIHGEYPHHTIVDILMDVDYEGAGEQNYWALMSEFKVLAREQNTALTVVHHTSESAKGGAPPPRSAIMGKANQLPTTILTLWGDAHRGTLDIAVVKNRFGPQDAMGKKYFTMKADPACCSIEEMDEMDVLFRDGTSVPDDEKVDVFSDVA